MVKGFVYIMLSKMLWIVSGFVIHIGLGRLLGPKLYGIFGVVISIITITYIFLGNGVRQAVTKYIADGTSDAASIKTTAFKIQAILSVLLAAALILFSRPLSILLGDHTLASLIKLSALIVLPTGIFFVYVGSLNGLNEFGKSATMSMAYATLKMVFVFLLVLLGLQLSGVIIGLALAIFFSTVLGMYFCRGQKYLTNTGQSNPIHPNSFKLISFAIPVSFFFAAIAILMNIDILFAKSLLFDDSQIGFYASAQTLSRGIYFVFTPFSVVLLPTISTAIVNDDLDLVRRRIEESLRYMFMLLMPASLMFGTTSSQLIKLLYSSAYGHAAYPLSILVFGISFLSVTLALCTIMQGYGAPNKPLVIFTFLIALDVLLLLLLVPRFQLIGAASATSITCLVGLIISCIIIYRKFNVLIRLKSFVRITLASCFPYGLAKIIAVPDVILPVFLAGLILFYFLILYLFKELDTHDISSLRNLLPTRLLPRIFHE